jgi:branched-chain amino acid transport system substrate-binding protein
MSKIKLVFNVATVAIAAAFFTASPVMAQDTIKVGVNVERSGVATSYGLHMLIATEIALEEVNSEGGINGAKLELVIEDNRSSPEQTVIVTRNLDKAGVVAMLGPITSTQCRTAFPAANRAMLPTISPGSAAPGLTAQNRPWTFRISAIDSVVVGEVIESLRKANPNAKTVAVVADPKDAYAQFLMSKVAPPLLEQHGFTIINQDAQVHVASDSTDFSVFVTKVKAMNPDVVLMHMHVEPAQGFLRESNRQKLNVPFFAGQGFITDGISAAAGDLELWAGQPFDPNSTNERVQKFVSEFKSRVQKQLPGQYTSPTYIDASSYESIKVLADGLRAAKATPKSDPTEIRESLRNYLKNLKDYPGLGNTLTMNNEGDTLKKTVVLRTRAGKWELR